MPKYTELRARRGKDGKWKGGTVYRQTVKSLDHRGRKIIVGLEPGDVITFREKGTHKTYSIPIGWAFIQAIKKEAERQAREKAKANPRRRVVRVKRGRL